MLAFNSHYRIPSNSPYFLKPVPALIQLATLVNQLVETKEQRYTLPTLSVAFLREYLEVSMPLPLEVCAVQSLLNN